MEIVDGVEVRLIPGYNFHYVSKNGKMYSKYGKYFRLLGVSVNPCGYIQVTFCEDKIATTTRVHRLVLKAFHRLPLKGEVARHLDGNKLNNNADNLVWGTQKENRADMIIHGTIQHSERHWKSKLTTLQVRIIRRCRNMPASFVGKVFRVNRETIYSIWNGSNWSYVSQSNDRRANAITTMTAVYRKLNFAQFRILLRCAHLQMPTSFLCRIFGIKDHTILKFKKGLISYKRCNWHNQTLGQYVRDLV